MTENKEAAELSAQEIKLKNSLAKKALRRASFLNEMKASSTFGKMVVWLKYKWFDSILFYVTLILTGTLLIVAARILWEIAKTIFNASL